MSDFLSLLPPNATDFELLLEQAVHRVGNVPVAIRDYWNADTIPENLMPWLGWEWSVDSWETNWTVDIKRSVLSGSFYYQCHKGTRNSVVDAVRSIGGNISIKEWWEYDTPKDVHTFDAVIDTGGGASEDTQWQLITAIDNAKPVRSHYTVSLVTSSEGIINIYGFGRVARFQRLYFEDVNPDD